MPTVPYTSDMPAATVPDRPDLDPLPAPKLPSVRDWERARHWRGAQLRASIGLGHAIDPGTAERVLRVQARTGLATDLVAARLDEIERDVARDGFDAEAYRRNSPIVADWYASNPHRVAVAREDFDRLGFIERTLRGMSLGFQHGRQTNELGRQGFRVGMGDRNPATLAQVEQLDRALKGTPAGDSFAATYLFKSARVVGQVYDTLATGKELIAAGAVLGGAKAAIAGQLGPQIALPEEAVTVPGGALVGAGLAATSVFTVDAFQIEAGHAYLELDAVRDEHGQPLDETTKRGAAVMVGTVNAALELVGLKAASKPITPVIRRAINGRVREALARPTMRAAALEFGKNYLVAVGGETGTEALQELTNIVADQAARLISDGKFETVFSSPLEADAAVNRLIGITTETMQAMALLGATGAGSRFVVDVADARRAAQHEAFFAALGDATRDSKLVKTLPDEAQKLIASITRDGAVETLYQDVDTWDDYWQGKGLNPRDVAAEVVGNAAAYDEAKAGGHAMAIAMARFATKIAPTEHLAYFQSEVRTTPEGMNGREAREFQSELEAMRQAEPPTDESADPAAQIRQDVTGQLLGAGFDQSAAETYASLYEATFRNLGERLGVDPMALYQQYGLRITRNLPDVLRQVSQTDTLDVMLDRVRAGDIFEPFQPPEPPQVTDPATLPAVEQKQTYTTVDPSWHGKTLYAWKSPTSLMLAKGTRAKGDKGRPGRSFPIAWQQSMERVPKDAKRLIARLRQYTDEVFEVQGTHGGFVLAPRGLVDQVKAELPDWEVDVQQADQRREERREKAAGVIRRGPVIPALAELQGLLRDLEIDLATTDNAAVREALNAATAATAEGEAFNQEFEDDLRAHESGNLPSDKPIRLGRPAQLLQSLGVPDRPIEMTQSVARKAREKHGLNADAIARLPERINAPVFVFKSKSSDTRRVIVTEIVAESGNNVVAVLELDAVRGKNEIVDIRSVYDKDSGKLLKWIESGLAVWADPVKSKAWLEGATPSDSGRYRAMLSEVSIDQPAAEVKPDVTFEQPGDESKKRGAIHISSTDDAGRRRFTIELFKGADLSTVLHELGHFYLEVLGDITADPNAPQQIKDDYKTILAWLGVKTRRGIKRKHHEQFARGMEAYLMEGKAPSSALRQAFARFRAWMLAIYRQIKRLNVELLTRALNS